MEQKTTWTRYLIFGISIITTFSVFSCRKDYSVIAKWVYINETEYKISYSPDYWNDFNVQPFDTTVYIQEMDGDKDVTADSYVAPFKPDIIYFGAGKCDSLRGGSKPNLGDGPWGMNNYESRKLGERYYEFTYRFTKQMVDSAGNCQ